jgi:hypothetical protein
LRSKLPTFNQFIKESKSIYLKEDISASDIDPMLKEFVKKSEDFQEILKKYGAPDAESEEAVMIAMQKLINKHFRGKAEILATFMLDGREKSIPLARVIEKEAKNYSSSIGLASIHPSTMEKLAKELLDGLKHYIASNY